MKKLSTLLVASLAIAALPACSPAHNAALDKAPGTYQTNSSMTNANGTDVSKKTTTNVTEDQYGNKHATVTTKTSTDPKGLFNKRTTTSTDSVDQNSNY